MKYKQIVFDVDGTLIDTEYAVVHSLQDTIADLTGKTIEIDELNFALGITSEDALRRFGMENNVAALSLWDKNMNKYSDSVHVFPGIHELLEALTKFELELGIVTSKTREEFEHDFVKFDIAPYFKVVVCADDTAEHKPNPEPLLKYMELARCSNKELIYIGDSMYDMECATRARSDFGLAEWGAKKRLNTSISLVTPFDAIKKLTA